VLPLPLWYKVVVVGVYGLIVGSYLPVVIYRVPRGMSTHLPRSSCPDCGHMIALYDIIPVFSWLWLRGRCRGCHGRISLRYPLVEGLCGVLYVALALRIGLRWELLAYLLVAPTLVALACIDAQFHLLPRRIVWPMTVVSVLAFANAALWARDWSRFGLALVCAAATGAFFLGLHLVNREGLGLGDVRLAPLLGLALGWIGWPEAVAGVTLGSFLGILVGVVLIASKRATAKTKMPYGTYLAIGALATVLITAGSGRM
jgi:leader peptidase (prepilin peptidase)/N-methyltransferase